MSEISDRYQQVCERVMAAAVRAGREPDSVRVVAVTKKFLVTTIDEARAAGITDIGENYAQEMAAKYDVLPRADEMVWHFIGHLQRNKVKQLIGCTDLIHTVDSIRLAEEIGKRAMLEGVTQPVLIEVALAGESSKSGIAKDSVEPLLERIRQLDGIHCAGFMVMPPWPEQPEDNRTWFAQLRQLRDRLATADSPLRQLSMGTSGDFEVAVEEGATLVRVGTAIFGPRPAL